MGPETAHTLLSSLEQFYRSNFDYNKLITASNEIVQKTRDEFTSRILKITGDSNPNLEKKELLNCLRVKLALSLISKFELKKDIQIQNRNSCKQMAFDIWYLLNSLVDNRLNTESYDVIKYSQKSKSINDSVVVDGPNLEPNSDLKKCIETLVREVQSLKISNDNIVAIVNELRSENAQLKKLINEQKRFKNFNLVNTIDERSVESGPFEPQYIQNGNKTQKIVETSSSTYAQTVKKTLPEATRPNGNLKKSKQSNGCIIGRLQSSNTNSAVKPPRLFDYYTGFWSLNSTKDSVKQIIEKFAKVESIIELKPKYDYYKSYHFQVLSNYKDSILNAENWPEGIRIKRFFKTKDTTHENSNDSNKNTKQKKTRTEDSVHTFRGGFGRGIKPVNTRGKIRNRGEMSDETSDEELNQTVSKRIDHGESTQYDDVPPTHNYESTNLDGIDSELREQIQIE